MGNWISSLVSKGMHVYFRSIDGTKGRKTEAVQGFILPEVTGAHIPSPHHKLQGPWPLPGFQPVLAFWQHLSFGDHHLTAPVLQSGPWSTLVFIVCLLGGLRVGHEK